MFSMSKAKKPTGGKHKTERRHIALPAPWGHLADELAAEAHKLTSWYVIELLIEKAKDAGKPIPAPPWEKQKAPKPEK